MALVFPVFEIGRGIDGVSVALVQYQYPMFGGRIPEHFRVACVLRVPFLLGVNHRILVVLREGTSFVKAVGGNHGWSLAFIESGGIIIVDDCRTGEHRS